MSDRNIFYLVLIVAIGLTGGGAYFGYAILYKATPTNEAWIIFYILIFLSGIFWIISFTNRNAQILSLILLGSIFVGLYSADVFFLFSAYKKTSIDVVTQLRNEGKNAFTSLVSPRQILKKNETVPLELKNGERILPVFGIANALTVFCNETGREWITITTDEIGYNNPKNIWILKPLQVALIGDSFAHGNCVTQNKTISGQLRKKYPASVSAGYGGNGPLLILASLIEVIKYYQPRHVFWLHYSGNDLQDVLQDVLQESENPVLINYLKNNFTQNLLGSREEIDRAMRAYHEEALARPFKRKTIGAWSQEILFLRNLRRVFDLTLKEKFKTFNVTERSYQLLSRALVRAKDEVESWGGKLHFVYLPSFKELIKNDKVSQEWRKEIFNIIKKLSLPVIDVTKIFSAWDDPSRLFTCKSCHYNAIGYALIAKAIVEHLKSDRLETKL